MIPFVTRSKFIYPSIFVLLALLVVGYSIFVRAQGLGYSNLQGDEVNTLSYLYPENSNYIDYLLTQKKGPVQFLVNFINTSIFGYVNEAVSRSPYLIFNILSLIAYYLFISRILNKNVALISVLLVAINGLFISYARIVQYQSLMLLLVPLVLVTFEKYLESFRYKYLIITSLLYAVAVLNHYDALTLLPYFVISFGRKVYLNQQTFKFILKQVLMFLVPFTLLNLAFYVPFLTHSAFDDSTKGYLESRFSGGGFMPRTGQTLNLISMYFPRIGLHLLFILSITGILFFYRRKFETIKLFSWFKPVYYSALYYFLVFTLLFSAVFSLYPIKPRTSSLLFIGASVAISAVMFLNKKISTRRVALVTWYLGAFCFYLFVMKDPRTHVYMAIYPGLILSGYAIYRIFNFIKIKQKLLSYFFLALVSVGLLYIVGLNWTIYVNKNPEYPWWNKQYLGSDIYKISKSRRIDGVFGFNNYRGWEQIGGYFESGCLSGSVESNEKDNLTEFYLGFKQANGEKWDPESSVDNLILVEGPHSWNYFPRRDYSNYILMKTIYSQDYPVTYIYGNKNLYMEVPECLK